LPAYNLCSCNFLPFACSRAPLDPLQTDSNAVSAAVLRITSVIRQIITEQTLRTLKPSKPTTLRDIVLQTKSRSITGHATGIRSARVINASLRLLITDANWAIDASSAARRVHVGEFAVASTGCHVGAIVGVGDAGHVWGAGGNFEAA